MKLLIVRHGQTLENIENICQGQSHGTLSELGKSQAAKLAVDLRDIHIDACYSSDLRRAVHTAQIISPIKPMLDCRLRERNFGSLQGQNLSKVLATTTMPPDVETIEQIWTRIESFMSDLKASTNSNDAILIVSHGYTIKVITAYLQHSNIDTVANTKTVTNCSVTEFNI